MSALERLAFAADGQEVPQGKPPPEVPATKPKLAEVCSECGGKGDDHFADCGRLKHSAGCP